MKPNKVRIDESDKRLIAPVEGAPKPPTPRRAARRKLRRPLYGIGQNSRLANLDFTDLDAILTDINVEWESSLDIMAPVSPGK